MENTNEELHESDISGLVFTVSKGGGGGSFPKLDLEEDEWYPAKLTEIKKVDRPGTADGRIKPSQGLNWSFELVGDEYTYEYDGRQAQQKIIGRTSMIFSSNPERPSRLFIWYCKLTGAVPSDGEKVILSNLIGMDVEIMVKKAPGKDRNGNAVVWHNVEKIKAATKKSATPQPTPTPSVEKSAIEKPAAAVEEPLKPTPVDDLYKDIF